MYKMMRHLEELKLKSLKLKKNPEEKSGVYTLISIKKLIQSQKIFF